MSFDKKTDSGVNVNKQSAEELYKAVIKKFKRRKNYARITDNIWAAIWAAQMRSLSSKNKDENIYYLS